MGFKSKGCKRFTAGQGMLEDLGVLGMHVAHRPGQAHGVAAVAFTVARQQAEQDQGGFH